MSTRLTYTGDGYQTSFAISFPYLSSTHVRVYVNEVLQLNPMNYTIAGGQVIFDDPPGVDAAIVIQRWTSPTAPLVDFSDGSTLKADELDTAYLHTFYLSQEYSDSFNKLIQDSFLALATANGVIVTEPDEVIQQLVQTMLADAAAATLQQRVNDIDTNAESIIQLGTDLQTQINTLAQGVAANVYIQPNEPVPGVGGVPDPILEGSRWYDSDDNNAPYIYQSGAWVSIQDPRIGQAVADISVLQTDVAGNTAAIVAESAARSSADGAFAATLALLGAQNGAQTAFILNSNTVKIDSDVGDTFATRFNTLSTADSTNAANITTEQNARITADGVLAADIALIGARNGASNAFILNSNTVKIDSDAGVTVAQKFTSLEAADSTLQGNIDTEQTARIAADGVLTSDVTALQSTINLRSRTFAQPAQPTADNAGDLWIDTDDGNKLYRYNGTSWVVVQDAAIGANASNISSLQTSVTNNANGISANVTSINNLSASISTVSGRVDTAEVNITANASAISSAEGDITTLEAKYGVQLNVNGYVTGFIQNNNGSSGSFVILADKFAVVDPLGGGGQTPLVPFEISGGKINMRGDVSISGSLLVNGTVIGSALQPGTIGTTQIGTNAITSDQINANAVTADKIFAGAVTADKISVSTLNAVQANTGNLNVTGALTMNTTGHMKGGATSFADPSNAGFWVGYDTSAYKFSIGNFATNQYMKWDGTSLTVKGDLNVGTYSSTIVDTFASALTERTDGDRYGSPTLIKQFTVDKAGSLTIQLDVKRTSGTGVTAYPYYQIYRGAVQIGQFTITETTYTQKTHTVSGLTDGSTIKVYLQGGERYDGAEYLDLQGFVRNVYLKGVITLNAGIVVDTD